MFSQFKTLNVITESGMKTVDLCKFFDEKRFPTRNQKARIVEIPVSGSPSTDDIHSDQSRSG